MDTIKKIAIFQHFRSLSLVPSLDKFMIIYYEKWMSRRLPPLNSLKTFEAAARHLSFTKAADELNVTQAAVSHQIKTLEERLGLPLFRRLNRALLLTDEAQQLYPAVSQALDIVSEAVDRLHRHEQAGVLSVTTMDSFAATWLVPRLGRFRSGYPDIDVRISTSDDPVDLVREGFDLAIRYGYGNWPGLHVERLSTEEVFPVCSPALLENGPPLERPDDLKHYTLLHDDIRVDWRKWLLAAGAKGVDPDRGPTFQHSNLVIQAAIQGDGIALARSVLSASALNEGHLVRPFELALPVNFAYFLVCPEGQVKRPKFKVFREWLISEMRASADEPMEQG